MKIPSTRPRAPCVFRFNSTEMASPARTLQSQRPLWSFAKLDIFPVSSIFSILLSNPRVATKTGLARWIRTCFACPSTGIKGTRETQRRIQEDAGRRTVSNEITTSIEFLTPHTVVHTLVASRRWPLGVLWIYIASEMIVSVHPVGGDFRGEIWKRDYVAGLNSKFGIGMRIGAAREILFYTF